jgi:hypothetical protein
MTTALYLLRCFQLGISVSDLHELTVGIVLDIVEESILDSDNSQNDEVIERDATQDDIEKFRNGGWF